MKNVLKRTAALLMAGIMAAMTACGSGDSEKKEEKSKWDELD